LRSGKVAAAGARFEGPQLEARTSRRAEDRRTPSEPLCTG